MAALPARSRSLFAAAGFILAAPAAAQEAASHGVEAWTEAVVSVADFEPATRLFRHAGGWRLVVSGEIAREELSYWALDGDASGTFERWCPPQVQTGCIRFIRFEGVEQEPIRPAARAWDTGGIYSIMVRSDNVPALYRQALDLGWWAESPPIRFQFGGSDLRNVVLQGPHGINLAVYERISPEFTGFQVGRISQGFNAMRMVRSRHTARDFYRDQLGFGVLFDGNNEPAEPAFSNFGIPYNYTPQIKRAAAALYPQAGETGRVEVMQIEGFTGHDHSARANPPNLGILSLRYPVESFAAYRTMIEQNGVTIAFAGESVTIAGLGEVDIFAVRDPDGNLTEFYSDGE
ncbi:VOC family protein [Altererythrobacter arenosus]|uniref:VOC family protein n=1 Tax=Altererythrobacter arenosus TaxID=3032592 RepID=A0ABY8FMW2_9SPHN|nr:VOC family protein [Altererythrobacter sp. CAU 1644]WFL76363.1 VOC family protein [Altererythrobacter sp. CAU 1644]